MQHMELPTESEVKEIMEIGRQYFKTDDDLSQMQPTAENGEKLAQLEKYNRVVERRNGKLAGWSVVFPTSKENEDAFLEGKITEEELFQKSVAHPSFESLYLLVFFVLPEYRREGIAKKLVSEQIKYFQDTYHIANFFVWAWSPEGKALVSHLEKELQIPIRSI